MRCWVVLLLAGALAVAGDEEERFHAAWFAAEDPSTVDAAALAFRDLLALPEASPALLARARLGLARCALTRGDHAEEGRELDAAFALSGDLPAIRRRILRWRGTEEWLHGLLFLQRGQFLDLDTGAILATASTTTGERAEVDGAKVLVATSPDLAFADRAPPTSRKLWRTLVTNEGRTSWVQELARSGPDAMLHFWTRRAGKGEVLPAVRGAFAVGRGTSIEIVFEGNARFTRYRVERRVGDEGPFALLAHTTAPVYVDREVENGGRYTYRLRGIEDGGRGGIPVDLAAAADSRGVFSGSCVLDRGMEPRFDFRTGERVEWGGDLVYAGRSGDGAARFGDAFGRWLGALDPRDPGEGSVWDRPTKPSDTVRSGETFLVPLRCGGVARCQLELPAGAAEAILNYDVHLDGPAFPPAPVLHAKVTDEGVAVRVLATEPWFVPEVEARDLFGPPEERAAWRIPVEGGIALDTRPGRGAVREYVAIAIDDRMRRTIASSCRALIGPFESRIGTFDMRYREGYSLERGERVAPGEADIVFQGCAAGISSITLQAPHGLLALSSVLGQAAAADEEVESFLDLVEGALPEEMALTETAVADSRLAASNVFLLRTRTGGWAKIAIVARAEGGPWMRMPATFLYEFHPVAPEFEANPGGGAEETRGGILLRGLDRMLRRERVLQQWRGEYARMRVAAPAAQEAQGEMPDAKTTQEVLLSRRAHGDPLASTFSFTFGLRDHPGPQTTPPDWEMQFDGADFAVRMRGEDLSTITDLGPLEWRDVALGRPLLETSMDREPVHFGHVYLVHKRDAASNFFALLRVTALVPQDRVAFEWITRDHLGLRRSRGLALESEVDAAIEKRLAALPATPDQWLALILGEEAVTREALREMTFRLGVDKAPLAAFLSDLSLLAGLRIELTATAAAAGRTVTLFGRDLTVDSILQRTGQPWSVRHDGSILVGE